MGNTVPSSTPRKLETTSAIDYSNTNSVDLNIARPDLPKEGVETTPNGAYCDVVDAHVNAKADDMFILKATTGYMNGMTKLFDKAYTTVGDLDHAALGLVNNNLLGFVEDPKTQQGRFSENEQEAIKWAERAAVTTAVVTGLTKPDYAAKAAELDKNITSTRYRSLMLDAKASAPTLTKYGRAQTKFTAGMGNSYSFLRSWGLPIFLVGSGMVAEAKSGIVAVDNVAQSAGLIEDGEQLIKGDDREFAKTAYQGGLFLGANYLLNTPANASYRKRVLPNGKVDTKTPMKFLYGAAFGGVLMAETWYFDNLPAQRAVIAKTDPERKKAQTESFFGDPIGYVFGPGYNPMTWDTDLIQTNTSAARSISWGSFGAFWSALIPLQNKATDLLLRIPNAAIDKFNKAVAKPTSAPARYAKAAMNTVGFSKAELPKFVTSNTAKISGTERAAIAEAVISETGAKITTENLLLQEKHILNSTPEGRAAKGLYRRRLLRKTFSAGRLTYTAANIPISLAGSIGVFNLMGKAQGYEGKMALSGTAMRGIYTGTGSTAAATSLLAFNGSYTPWTAFAFTMPTINYPWRSCTIESEALYQSAVEMADEYQNFSDPATKVRLRTKLYNLHRMATGDEKERIAKVLADAQIDVDAIDAWIEAHQAL